MKIICNILSSVILIIFLFVVICNPLSMAEYDNLSNISGENNEYNQHNESLYNDEEYESGEEQFIYIDNGTRVQALVTINIRSLPSTDSEKMGLLHITEMVEYIDTYDSGWYEVYYDNKKAYISANRNYTKLINRNDYVNNQALIDTVIECGMKLLGVPYEYGAQRALLWNKSPNPDFTGKTFDCSSFVQYIYYKGAGIKLDGDSRSQSKNGINIEHKSIRRGDILVMTSTSRQYNTGIERIGHVAIYLGNNKILHTFGTGGVRIQDYSDFWKGRFIMARRVIY